MNTKCPLNRSISSILLVFSVFSNSIPANKSPPILSTTLLDSSAVSKRGIDSLFADIYITHVTMNKLIAQNMHENVIIEFLALVMSSI